MKDKKRKKYLTIITIISVVIAISEMALTYIDEKIHQQYYGHYITYNNLHVDVVKYEIDKTIGLNHPLYSVSLKNATFFPIILSGYKVKNNFEHRGDYILLLPYKREKFDKTTSKWLELVSINPGQIEHLKKKTVILFPFQSISVIDYEDPTFDKSFQPNDILRYNISLDSSFGVTPHNLFTSSEIIE